MEASVINALNKTRSARQSAVLLTELATGGNQLVMASDVAGHEFEREISSRLRSGKSGVVSIEDREVFIHVYTPSPRLVIIGAVHITQALVPMAQACDFEVSVIDPRTAFATPERFSDVTLFAEWPVDILETHPLDEHTALVAVTHDPKIDDIPLHAALKAKSFYVGALGSRKTHGKQVERLLGAGCTSTELDRIHAPIGLDIGAATPAEIAVAVMAEIIQTRRKGSAT